MILGIAAGLATCWICDPYIGAASIIPAVAVMIVVEKCLDY